MKNPFIPLDKADAVIIDGRVNQEVLDSLKKLNLKIIKTTKCKDVEDSISYHPDIVIHPISHNTFVVAPNVFDYYDDKLSPLGIKLIKGEKFLECKYPLDIAYNVGRIYGAAIHNFKHTDKVLKFYLKKQGLKLIDINQGYTKCSMSIVNQNSIITADSVIYKKLTDFGYRVLLISPGNIDLKNQKYGFIGGSTGNLSKDTMLFSGVLKSHPDEEKIKKFIFENNSKIKYLSKENIMDIGTIISFKSNLC